MTKYVTITIMIRNLGNCCIFGSE